MVGIFQLLSIFFLQININRHKTIISLINRRIAKENREITQLNVFMYYMYILINCNSYTIYLFLGIYRYFESNC